MPEEHELKYFAALVNEVAADAEKKVQGVEPAQCGF